MRRWRKACHEYDGRPGTALLPRAGVVGHRRLVGRARAAAADDRHLRKYRYDDALIYREYPFLIKDVFFSAVLVAANDARLDSEDFCGHPRLRWPLLPSTSPAEPAFEPRNYWRGPIWPVINWLLWHSLHQLGSARQSWTAAVALDWLASGR